MSTGGALVSGIVILGPTGRPEAGVLINVFQADGTTPASIFADPALTSPMENPTVSDALGNVVAYAAPGVYKYTVLGAGISFVNQPYTATVAGTGGGDLLAGADNTLTGHNTFLGQSDFTGNTYFGSGRPWFDVRAFGAFGNNIATDTPFVQNAINACAVNGGIVFFPTGTYRCNVTVPAGVILIGCTSAQDDVSSGQPATTLKSAVTGTSPVVTVTASVSKGLATSIKNLMFLGNGTGATDQGVFIAGANGPWLVINECSFENFGQQAVLQQGPGGKLVMSQCFAISCLLDRVNLTNRGVVEVHAANFQMHQCEVGPSQHTLSNATLTNAAVLIDGGSCYISNVVAEFGEVGFRFTVNAFGGNIANSQSNFSQGHGWAFVASALLQVSNCTSLVDGQAAANTYDGFNLSSSCHNNMFVNCLASINGSNPLLRYGFNDSNATGLGNKYSNCFCFPGSYGTAAYNLPAAGFNSVNFGTSPTTIADAVATPDVTQASFVQFLQSTGIAYTNFIGGVNGQSISLLGNANVTINNGATIKTNTGGNITLAANKIYRFVNVAGVWVMDA